MKRCLLIVDYKGHESPLVFRKITQAVRENISESIYFKIFSIPGLCDLLIDDVSEYHQFILSQLRQMEKNNQFDFFLIVISRYVSNDNFNIEMKEKIILTQNTYQKIILMDNWKNFEFYRLIHLYNHTGLKILFSKIHNHAEGAKFLC